MRRAIKRLEDITLEAITSDAKSLVFWNLFQKKLPAPLRKNHRTDPQ